MKHLKQFENWTTTSTSTNDKEVEYDYTSKDSIYHGIRDINVSRDGIRTKAKAKFDSGARSSSIDFKVAKRLGISDEFLKTSKELDSVDLAKYTKDPRNISLSEQGRIERGFYKDLKTQFPELSDVKLVKSSSGFSVRMVIRIDIEYSGKVISTDANLRDRTGLACEMLVGLKDM
jgi:hypothetical protein